MRKMPLLTGGILWCMWDRQQQRIVGGRILHTISANTLFDTIKQTSLCLCMSTKNSVFNACVFIVQIVCLYKEVSDNLMRGSEAEMRLVMAKHEGSG
jgi:hypothetical protein